MSRPSEAAGGSLFSIRPIQCALGGQYYTSFILTQLAPLIFVGVASLMILPAKYVKNWMRTRRLKQPPPTFLGRFGIPQKWARWKCLRTPMTREDIRAWNSKFRPSARLAAVTVFMLFSFYPALVKSIASIFKCTSPIEGKRYLDADMSIVCYEGDHIVYVLLASLAGVIYAAGIPLAVALVTAFKTPIVCRGTVKRDRLGSFRGNKKKRKAWLQNSCVCGAKKKTRRTTAHDGAITSHNTLKIDKTRKAALKQYLEMLQRKFQLKSGSRTSTTTTRSGEVCGVEMQNTLHGPAEASGESSPSPGSSSASSTSSSSSSSSSSSTSSSSSSYSSSDSSDVQVDLDHTTDSRIWIKPRFTCSRRHSSKYATTDVRTRFGFLFAGYSTNRSGIVVSWEAIVMLRKLAVTLSGSVITDPYLSILSAQLILIISAFATALVQPYVTLSLNLLDVFAMFALIVTQILSILYFYVDNTEEDPFMDPKALEIATTVLLFVLNVVVFVALIGMYIWEATQRTRAYGRQMVKCVTDPGRVLEAILSKEKSLWRHPNGTAVSKPPHKVQLSGSSWSVSPFVPASRPPLHSPLPLDLAHSSPAEYDVMFWLWAPTSKAPMLGSVAQPELLIRIKSFDDLAPNEYFRWMSRIKTQSIASGKKHLSKKHRKWANVGGELCCWEKKTTKGEAVPGASSGRDATRSRSLGVKSQFKRVRGAMLEMTEDLMKGRGPRDDGSLPDGWTMHKAPDGVIYYLNDTDGKSQWERPECTRKEQLAELSAAAPRWASKLFGMPGASSRSLVVDLDSVDEGWMENEDSSGNTYYTHSDGRPSVWELPDAADCGSTRTLTVFPRHGGVTQRMERGPSAPREATSAALPPGWVEEVHGESGAP